MTRARWFHLVTAVTATFALVLQFVLVWQGHSVLETEDPPALGERVIRYFGYFTILSNALVAYSTWTLALGRDRDATWWRVLRLDGLIGITVTFAVVQVLLQGLVELEGADLLADNLLHIVVPVLAVAGWILFGPRGRVRGRDVALALVPPVIWLAYTLIRGSLIDWYPYPFLDAGKEGYASVAITCLAITAFFLALAALVWKVDGHLPKTQLDR